MKNILLGFLGVVLILSGSTKTFGSMDIPPIQGSAELQKLKSFAGEWSGKHKEGDQEMDAVVTYEVTSNGSAVVEKLLSGTPHEMVTIYYDDKNGKLAMTHFCAIGNHPQMSLTSTKDNQFDFVFSERSDLDPATDDHMHAFSLFFIELFLSNSKSLAGNIDAGERFRVSFNRKKLNKGEHQLGQEWTLYQDGKPAQISIFDFIRKI